MGAFGSSTGLTDWTVQANAAVVANNASNPIVSTKNEYGCRYALVAISCNQTHDIAFYAADSPFSAITNAYKLADESRNTLAAVSGYGFNLYYVYVGGAKHFAVAVTNKSGAADATVTVKVKFFDP